MTTSEIILACTSAVLAVWGIAQFFINRRDKKKGELKEIKSALNNMQERFDELDRHTLRIQLQLLIYHEPKNIDTIMKVSEKYFIEKKGDWWMTTKFKRYCNDNEIPYPDWVKDIK